MGSKPPVHIEPLNATVAPIKKEALDLVSQIEEMDSIIRGTVFVDDEGRPVFSQLLGKHVITPTKMSE